MNSDSGTRDIGGECLATWDQLAKEVRRRWPVLEETSDSILIGNRRKRIRIDRLAVAEPALSADTYVAVRVELDPGDRLDPRSALQINAKLAIGSFSMSDSGYELRHAANLSCLSIAHLDKILGYLGKLGDAFRRDVDAPGASDLACFNHLVD